MNRTAIVLTAIFCALAVQHGAAQMVGSPYIFLDANKTHAACAGADTKGKDFWVITAQNKTKTSSQVELMLKIVNDNAIADSISVARDVMISLPRIIIPANSVYTLDLSRYPLASGTSDIRDALYVSITGVSSGISSKSPLRITSTQPVSIYAFNAGTASTDAAVILPVTAWGSEYYRLSSSPYNASNVGSDVYYDVELIVASENSTQVTLPDTIIVLRRGDVYYKASTADMTGRHITSSKPVAYFTHTTLSSVPSGRMSGDIIYEQSMPVDRWGTQYLVPNVKQSGKTNGAVNSENNMVRVIAAENGTVVNFSGANYSAGQNISSGDTLNAGQWIEMEISNNAGACHVDASKPVGVSSYMTGDGTTNTANDIGDPAVAWIPALSQLTPSVAFTPFAFDIGSTASYTEFGQATSQHYAVIIIETPTKSTTTINNGKTISWTDHYSGYSYGKVTFDINTDKNRLFKVTNSKGVIVLAYGLASLESYYFNAGSGTCIIN